MIPYLGSSQRLKEALLTSTTTSTAISSRPPSEQEFRGVNFQVLRRTCGTLFGDRARGPRLTQAQLRHVDPQVTLKHYQNATPHAIKAAAIALETDLFAVPQNLKGLVN